jgi:hypothetical protein
MFLCEHWLTVQELSIFNDRFKKSNMWTNLKSSVDPETVLIGRPHGGIGFIAKRIDDIVYKSI